MKRTDLYWHIECPECGTEIEAADCECIDKRIKPDPKCEICCGSGKTSDFYCSNCGYQKEE